MRTAWLLALGGWCTACLTVVAGEPQPVVWREIGSFFVPNAVGITGMDCASSVPLGKNEALWLFGDSVVGPFRSIRELPLGRILSSSGALVTHTPGLTRNLQFLTEAQAPHRARPLIVHDPDEPPGKIRLWPVHGIAVGDEVYLFYHKISLLPYVDVFTNFRLEGMGIAKGKGPDWKFQRLRRPDGSREFWSGDQPGFGVWVQRADDGYVYLWGSAFTAMFLARCVEDQLANPAAYEYLVAAPTRDTPDRAVEWSTVFRPTAPLFEHVPNEMSVSYNEYLGAYLAIHTWDRENRLVLRTAPRLSGPWSDPVTWHTPDRQAADDYFYAAKEHPELARDGGRLIYVTFVNSARYQPRLLELRLDGEAPESP